MEARLGSTWKLTCSLLPDTTVWEEAVWVVDWVSVSDCVSVDDRVWVVDGVETVADTEVDVEAEAVTPTLNVTEAETN